MGGRGSERTSGLELTIKIIMGEAEVTERWRGTVCHYGSYFIQPRDKASPLRRIRVPTALLIQFNNNVSVYNFGSNHPFNSRDKKKKKERSHKIYRYTFNNKNHFSYETWFQAFA